MLASGPALTAVLHSQGETITKIQKADNEDELVDIGGDDDVCVSNQSTHTNIREHYTLPSITKCADI